MENRKGKIIAVEGEKNPELKTMKVTRILGLCEQRELDEWYAFLSQWHFAKCSS